MCERVCVCIVFILSVYLMNKDVYTTSSRSSSSSSSSFASRHLSNCELRASLTHIISVRGQTGQSSLVPRRCICISSGDACTLPVSIGHRMRRDGMEMLLHFGIFCDPWVVTVQEKHMLSTLRIDCFVAIV